MARKTRIKLLRGTRASIASSNVKLEKGELLLDTDDGYLFAGLDEGVDANNTSNILKAREVVGYVNDSSTLNSSVNPTDKKFRVGISSNNSQDEFQITGSNLPVNISSSEDIHLKAKESGKKVIINDNTSISSDGNTLTTNNVSASNVSADKKLTVGNTVTIDGENGNIQSPLGTLSASIVSADIVSGFDVSANTASVASELTFGNDINVGSNYGNAKVVIGVNASSKQTHSVAIGNEVLIDNASGCYSVAIGYASRANKNFGVSIGTGSNVSGYNSIAIGMNAIAYGSETMALGSQSNASGANSISIGVNSNSSGSGGVAVGNNTKSTAPDSIAIGNVSNASGTCSISIGKNANASDLYATAIGYKSNASGVNSTASGQFANASGESSAAIGYNSVSIGESSIAVGDATKSIGFASTAVGPLSNASGCASTAVGYWSESSGYCSTAVGQGATVTANNSVQLGDGTNSNESTLQFRNTKIADGSGNVFTGFSKSISLDSNRIITDSNGITSSLSELVGETLYITYSFLNRNYSFLIQVPATINTFWTSPAFPDLVKDTVTHPVATYKNSYLKLECLSQVLGVSNSHTHRLYVVDSEGIDHPVQYDNSSGVVLVYKIIK